MTMHMMKTMRDKLLECASAEDLQTVDTEELGEVIDMIKDLEEAMYYHSVVKAMEADNGQESVHSKKMQESAHMKDVLAK